MRSKMRLALLGLLAVLPTFVWAGTSAQNASATLAPFSLTTTPGITPAFSPTTYWYAVRCTGAPTINVATSGGRGYVRIGGLRYLEPANVDVPLTAGQAVTVHPVGQVRYYTIRCLPSDFPTYTATLSPTEKAQAPGYLVAPSAVDNYIVDFDGNGVPVWWYKTASSPANDQKFLSPTRISYWGASTQPGSCGPNVGYGHGTETIIDLNGKVQTQIGQDVNPSLGLDTHDFQLLPNGDYLGQEYVCGRTADLSSWGLSTTQPVVDCWIVVVDPQSNLVSYWSALDHIDPATATDPNFRALQPDVFHMNSIQVVGNTMIVSFRHLSAVYGVDMLSGNILWKLGGSPSPQSLTVLGDNSGYSQILSGQHYARMLPDGTLTVQDNSTFVGQVRALHFSLDTTAMTATVLEDVTDANYPGYALCCGSAARLPGGDWVTDWGYGTYTAELDPAGNTVVSISYPAMSYRADVSQAGDAQLSKGMDAQVAQVHCKRLNVVCTAHPA